MLHSFFVLRGQDLCVFSIYSTAQLALATFPVLSSHLWPVAVIVDSAVL